MAVLPTAAVWGIPTLLAMFVEGLPAGPSEWKVLQWIAVGVFLPAAGWSFWCAFMVYGPGTRRKIGLVAPPTLLITSGPFGLCRNPMMLGLLGMIGGMGFFLQAWSVGVYFLAVAIGAHLVIQRFEEPSLRATFGSLYVTYCREVPRWIPRFRTAVPVPD